MSKTFSNLNSLATIPSYSISDWPIINDDIMLYLSKESIKNALLYHVYIQLDLYQSHQLYYKVSNWFNKF